MADYQDPILITGCARSGTSIIAGIIHYCGAWGGVTTGASRYNKKGQFENRRVRDQITKVALRARGLDPLGQSPLADPATWVIDPTWRQKVLQVLKDEKYPGGPWFYKGAKMCQFWPQWVNAFPQAKWVIVRREPSGIVSSCLKTAFMRAYKDEKGWMKWVNIHLQRFQEMKDAGLDIVEVWPAKVISGRYGEVKYMINHLGLEWNRGVIHEFITPRLWSGKEDRVPPEVNDGES